MGLDLILLAAVERAPVDTEVAVMVAEAFAALGRATGAPARTDTDDGVEAAALSMALTAAVLGLRVRARAGAAAGTADQAGAALAHRLDQH
ncbi:hypothetical protein [Streptomyces sp. NPDC051567]|uniref:hypothetical protein n=1 Tax=Streptomyces sp. NPDC051567 TaxID=3365660 RepID=UPI0037A0C271